VTLSDTPLPLRKSLRARGWMATMALLAYLLGAGFYIAGERAKVFADVQALEQLSQHEKALALTEAAVGSALVDVSEAGSAGSGETAVPADLRLYMETCTRLFAELERHDAGYARLQRAIERSHAALLDQPVRANWIDLREALHRAADDLEIRHRRLSDMRDALTLGYQRRFDAVSVQSALLAIVGLVAFGSLAAWFFARLARDIRRLEEHAGHVVRGTRGVALAVRRDDELGRLMHAVNRMAADLDAREKQLQVEAQQRSHQDKMMTVGALAAGVAHEVNNPLAVIGGLAQELQAGASGADAAQVADNAAQILLQVQRAGLATRQLAEVSTPQPAELAWVDVNALLRQAAQLMGYDRRYRRFAFELALDPALPAVRSSPGAVQQVLMQLLSLVCAALALRPEVPAKLCLATLTEGDGVAVQLRFPPVLDFTRGEVQRSLLLCRAIVEPLRGRLAFGQVEGPLQRIQLLLPAVPGSDEG
jgi:two-component system, NtrC family, sensor kinase